MSFPYLSRLCFYSIWGCSWTTYVIENTESLNYLCHDDVVPIVTIISGTCVSAIQNLGAALFENIPNDIEKAEKAKAVY